ncbi:DUF2267 domain-containing protein [Candidatus Microgenomates bacterium]|nr:MAG: DUF2267 domain-containing protein [Candidatus Microgenomates bacterium]
MSEQFEATIQKTNELLKEIERKFCWENRRNQSYAALRAVLHTLRNRLTVEEAVQLGAQLPMLIRGMYYEGWNPKHVPVKMDKEEFLGEIRRQFPLSIEGTTEDLVCVVLQALQKYISFGEAQNLISILPKDIAQMFDTFIKKEV